jgi:hypothetical protein
MAGMNPLELRIRRQGEFDGYKLHGDMFQLHGELRKAWYVTSASSLGEINTYWIEHDQFHTVISHIATPPTGANYFDVGDVIDVKETERAAISRAVEQWTQEYHDKIIADSGD